MSFKKNIGLPMESFEDELYFNRELIHTKGLREFSLSEVVFRGENKEDEKEKIIVFKKYQDIFLTEHKPHFDDVRFDIFVILPGFHSGEFNHIPGYYRNYADNGFHFPELFQVVEGYAEFLLQQPAEKHEKVKDCILYRCQVGEIVTIPPAHGVTIINPTDKKTVVIRLRARDAESIHEHYNMTRGACYYREQNDKWIFNSNYEEIATMKLLPTQKKWKVFQKEIPIYQSFINNTWSQKFLLEPNPVDFIIDTLI
ncbi:MAG: hypothetical protein K9W45_08215 [Candidatus Heimdallarchaeum aukensis]|uniref:glucose-6-phosphate isomerase n=1 Tax=Candidatus Heimdallarchaeum aukensis TaxID=2876573 RepID=A0A9Y1FKG8_9ARCH|nr:MAG: hypothetical protein K9W45_08215 [Candidatus Heimdallarchaeum aukensis]